MLKHWLPKGREFIREGHDAQFAGRIVAPNGSMLGKSSWKKLESSPPELHPNKYLYLPQDALTHLQWVKGV